MKKLILLLLVLTFFVGGGSLRTFALISTPTRDFPLSTPVGSVTGHWDQATQTLSIVGNGKIDVDKWKALKNTTTSLHLVNANASGTHIQFHSGVQFPDNAGRFFEGVYSTIGFPASMDVSNVTDMSNMFSKAYNFNAESLNWSVPKVTTMVGMFHTTPAFTGKVHFTNADKVGLMINMFYWSRVKEVKIENTAVLTRVDGMFWDSAVEKVEFTDLRKVQMATRMFIGATKFNADIDREVPELKEAWSMFQGTTDFTGKVILRNAGKLSSLNSMFQSSAVKEVEILGLKEATTMKQMFYRATNLETVSFGPDPKATQTVKTMASMFDWASKFNTDIDRDLSETTETNGMFANTPGFSGKVKLRNTGKIITTQTMFHSSAVREVEFDGLTGATTMIQMFAKTENLQKLKLWDTSNVQDMSQMFRRSTMNLDISDLRIDALTNGSLFIRENNKAFSRVNYDKLLSGWASRLPAIPRVPSVPITINAPYCLGKAARAEIIAKGYSISRDRLDCGLSITERPAAKISSGTMAKRQIIIQSAAPIHTGSIKIIAGNLGYSNLKCTSSAALPTKVNCYLDITATPVGALSQLTIQATDTMWDSEQYLLSGFIIDTKKPEIGQVSIDVSNGISTPKVKLRAFPRDEWGSGFSGCNFVYTGDDGTLKTVPASTSESDLSFDPSETTHTLRVLCYDKVGNSSENLIKFPPIITFNPDNLTLSNQAMNGVFEVYSPSSVAIGSIQLNYSDNTPVSFSCRSQIDNGTTPPFTNSPTAPVRCEYSNANRSGTLVAKAQDINGAAGQQMQSVILDTTKPHITITPENALTSGNLVVKIQVFDAVGIQTWAVSISSSLDHSDWDCVQSSSTMVRCQFTANTAIQNWNLTITANDLAGNEESKTTSWYTIDQTLPSIDYLNATFLQSWTKLLVSFSGSDGGWAGLWRQSESGNPQFDYTAISYGLASDALCSDYVSVDSLTPQETEPYDLSFEFDDVSKNGQYLCIVLKDKVWNPQTGALSAPLNLNLAPSFPAHTATIAENSAIGSLVSLLTGSDANAGDTLTYTIIEGNTGAVFSTQNNRLLVNGLLDYETLSGYRLIIQVSDQYGLFGTGEMEITVSDRDEIVPVLSTGSSVSYPQGATITPIIFTGSDNQAISGRKVTGLPAGLTFEGTTGATAGNLTISGTLSAPAGTYLISVELSDHEGNVALQTFTITIKTSSQPGYSWWWGKALSQPTNQNSDPQTPVQTENQVKFNDSDLFNPTIEDGKCYTRRLHQWIQTSTTFPTTEEFNKALSFLWSYEMTKYDSVAGYDPYRNLSRQEAAKIFSQFATNVLCRKPDQNLKVNYSDTENADPSLKPYITLAYQLGLMKGSGQGDGLFRPYEMISKAEVNAVLIRMILKAYLNETSLTNWFSNYNEVATKLGIINQWAGLQSVPRNDVALMLFRAYKNQVFDRQEIDYFSYVLKSRDLFVK